MENKQRKKIITIHCSIRNYSKQAVDRKQTDKLPENIITIGNK
jgi:hypothetical protein